MTPDSDKESLAKRLREARTYLGFSQEYVAKHLKLTRPAISKIEAGLRNVSSLELNALSQLYGRPINDLLGQSAQEETVAVEGEADPLLRKLRSVTRELRAEDREAILHFIEYLKHRNAYASEREEHLLSANR
jgi:transcriptional regulator with XRE-family HTH domain